MIEIKELAKEHIDEIVEIEKSCFSAPWSKDSFLKELDNGMAHYYVATIDDKVVGYGGFWYIINECHINNIAVHQDFRGQKIATQIMDAMIEKAKYFETIGLTLEVRVTNEVAINFYEKMGFVQEGVRKKYYENNEDALIMWLNFE